MHACMHTYIHTHIHPCMHACMHTYIHTHIYIYVYYSISLCVCTYAHARTNTYSVWKICRQKYAQNFKLSLCSLSLTSRQIVQKPPEEGGGSPGSSDPAASWAFKVSWGTNRLKLKWTWCRGKKVKFMVQADLAMSSFIPDSCVALPQTHRWYIILSTC